MLEIKVEDARVIFITDDGNGELGTLSDAMETLVDDSTIAGATHEWFCNVELPEFEEGAEVPVEALHDFYEALIYPDTEDGAWTADWPQAGKVLGKHLKKAGV